MSSGAEQSDVVETNFKNNESGPHQDLHGVLGTGQSLILFYSLNNKQFEIFILVLPNVELVISDLDDRFDENFILVV